MKPKSSRFLRSVTCGSLLIAWSQLGAVTLAWDANGVTEPNPNGGTGTWEATPANVNWWDGAANITWPTTGTDNDAVFGDNAGTVAIAGSGGITVNDVTFNTAGYTINGTGITFNGTTPTLTNEVTATINAPISGNATKTGAGSLYLNTLNIGAALTVDQGTVYGNAGGNIKGLVQINPGATFRNTTAHVFDTANARVHINGGTLTHGPASYPEYYIPQGTSASDPGVQFTGGTMDGQNRFNSGTTAHVRINAADTTATHAGLMLTYQGGTQIYHVVGGTTADGVDFRYSSEIAGNFGGGTTHVSKTGAGLMEITGRAVLNANGNFTLADGTLRLTGNNAVTNFGSGTSEMKLDTANAVTLQLNAVNAADSHTFSKNITGGSAAATVSKIGAGTVTLSGANTFTGSIAITSGALYLNSSFTNAPTVSVGSGTALGGTSATVGNVALANGATLEGGVAGVGTLTAANVTLGAASTDTTTLKGTIGGDAPLAVANLTIKGGAGLTLLDVVGTGLTNGSTYDLLVSAAPITAPNAASVLATLKTNSRSLTPVVDGTGRKIQLLYGTPDSIYWTGAVGSAWNTTDANWKLTTTNAGSLFMSNDIVFFHNSPTSDTVDISGANVTPASVTFDNTAATTYTLTGTHGIAGAASLEIKGGGKVILANSNAYTGDTLITAGTLQLGDDLANGSLAAGGFITIDGTLVIANSNGDQSQGTHFSSASLIGLGSLYKTGASQLTLTAANTHGGGTTVSQGSLRLNHAAGAGTSITLGDANTGDASLSLTCPAGTSTPITIGADNAGEGMVTISQPTQYTTLSSPIEANRPATLSASGDRVSIAGPISGNPGTLTFAGTRTTLDQTEANASDFTGTVVVSGTLQLNSIFGLPATADVTASGYFRAIAGATIDSLNGSGTVNNNSGGGAATTPLSLGNANGDGSFSGTLQNGSGSDIMHLVKNGTGTQELVGPNITYTGATTVNNGTLTLGNTTGFASSGIALSDANPVTLALDTPTDWTFAKNITGGATANTRIVKSGTGAITFAGAGTTFGSTAADAIRITEGALFLDAPFTGVAALVTGTLGGGGSVGNVTLNDQAVIEGGHSGSGFLTTGDLTIGTAASNANTVKGTLAAGHTPIHAQALTLNGGNGSVLLSAAGAGLMSGQYYDVISYTSISAPNATSPQNVFTSTSRAYSPYINTAAKKVQLYYDANASLYWTGSGSTEWSTTPGLNNWKLNGTNGVANFQTNDVAVFDNRATNTTVAIDIEDVSPISTTFDNDAAHPYTVEGWLYGIATGALTKSGTGTLTLASYNTYTGGTTINAGVLEVGSTDALGTSGFITMNGGTLRYSDANGADYSVRLRLNDGQAAIFDTNGRSVTFANILTTGTTGTASLRKAGAGTLTLGTTAASNNTYSGGTVISAGTLRLDGGSNGYCAGSGTITLGDANTPAEGASLGVYGAAWTGTGPDRWVQNEIVVAATGTGSGPLMIFRPAGVYAATFRGPITLANDVIFRNTTGDRLALEGKITGTGNVTIEGNRVNIDNSTNDYVGTTTIALGGTLQLNNNNVLPATSDVTLNGTLSFQSDAATALTIASLAGSGTVNIPWGSGNPVLTVGADGATHDADFSGAIQSRVALTKVGDCAQTLGGTNTYTGATLVEKGKLIITGTNSGAGSVTVNSGATLGGTGTITGATTIGGTLAPGASAGTLTFTGTVDLQAGSTYAVEITGTATHDKVVAAGLSANGTIAVTLGTFVPANGEVFDLADGTISGTPAFAFTDSSAAQWDTTSFATDGTIKYLGGTAGYASWAAANAPGQSIGMDHDHDSVSNGIEYFMGQSGSGFTALPAMNASGAVSWPKGASYTGTYGTHYVVETSANLATWTPVPVGSVSIDADSVDYTLPRSGPKGFARLKVTGP